MNVHDSERIAGLLDEAGFTPVVAGEQADIVVFNTCAVRENADNKLYGNLSFLAPIKKANPNMQIAVGGCLAQKDQATILKKAPYALKKSHRSKSLKHSSISPPPCQLDVYQHFLHGFQFQLVAITHVLFASSQHYVESKKIAMKLIFCLRLKPLLIRGLSRLLCWGKM
jgi:hypothetical protein